MGEYIIGLDKEAMQNRINDIKNNGVIGTNVETDIRALTIGQLSQGPNAAQMREIKKLLEEILALQRNIYELTAEYLEDVKENFIDVDESGG